MLGTDELKSLPSELVRTVCLLKIFTPSLKQNYQQKKEGEVARLKHDFMNNKIQSLKANPDVSTTESRHGRLNPELLTSMWTDSGEYMSGVHI